MRMHKGWLLGLILVLAGSTLSGCLAGEEKSASDEGLEEKVVVYSPHGKDILSEFEKQFEKEHPRRRRPVAGYRLPGDPGPDPFGKGQPPGGPLVGRPVGDV